MFPIQLSLVLLSLAVSSASLSSARAELSSDSLKQARSLVERVNSAGAGWTAELYPRFAGMTKAQFRSMNGIHVPEHLVGVSPKQLEKAPTSVADPSIPEEFDPRTHWPNCADVVNHIRDQSRCGSCWAVSAAGAFSDRICITTNGRTKVSVSSIDVASCAKSGRDGCQGSDSLVRAWDYFFHTGAVTGSGWHEQQGCKPYPFPLSAKATRDFRSPRCSHRCQKGYTGGTYEQEKFRVYAPTSINGGSSAERARLLQQELMAHGSVPVAFIVYGDFSSYKSGVYRHVTGEPTGGHAVRLVGWGVDKGSGTPYWLVANSWGPDWGEKGFFRIRRGTDECFIESMMVPYAGVPIGLNNNATSTVL